MIGQRVWVTLDGGVEVESPEWHQDSASDAQ